MEELAEAGIRSKESESYAELVSGLEQADVGCNPSSMYELCGEYHPIHACFADKASSGDSQGRIC